MGQRNGAPEALSMSSSRKLKYGISQIEKLCETAWRIPAVEPMRMPGAIYGGESLIRDME